MKLYVLTIDYDEFQYDEVANMVVLANDWLQALEIARQTYDGKWDIDKVIELDGAEPQLIESYIHYG